MNGTVVAVVGTTSSRRSVPAGAAAEEMITRVSVSLNSNEIVVAGRGLETPSATLTRFLPGVAPLQLKPTNFSLLPDSVAIGAAPTGNAGLMVAAVVVVVPRICTEQVPAQLAEL